VPSVHGEDVIMVGIFSHVPSGSLRKTWVRLDAGHPDFAQSGLKKTSVLKAEKIAVIHESVLQSEVRRSFNHSNGSSGRGFEKGVLSSVNLSRHLRQPLGPWSSFPSGVIGRYIGR